MGFLAFLLVGGGSGASAWIFYPRRPKGAGFFKFLLVILLGFMAAFASSYIGQYQGFFQSGQMLEWVSAIVASSLVGGLYSALAK